MADTPKTGRIEARFAALKKEGRAGLVCFVTSGDPDPDASLSLLNALPAAGADIIEFGMPFSDPMADGPTIQASSQRALRAGQTLRKTLAQVRQFRESDNDTPLILMGYYNPIYVYGVEVFIRDALAAGVDGLIVVDLPPEEDDELCIPATRAGLRFIRLATPTTSNKRLPAVLTHASGFLYYVSMTGITGSADANQKAVADALSRLRPQTDLPIAVGFGIKTPAQAAAIAKIADGVVVGSAIVEKIGQMQGSNADLSQARSDVLDFVRELAAAVRQARR